MAKFVLKSVEGAYQRVTSDIGYRPRGSTRIFMAATEEEFASLTRGAIPDWGIGCAYPGHNLIILRSQKATDSRGMDLAEIAVHEFTHVVLGQAVGGKRIPRWFDEGLAMYESREWEIGQGITLARAAFSRSIIPLNEIDRVLTFQESKARLAYMESFLAVSFIIQEYGIEKFHEIISQLARTGDMDQTLRLTIGLSLGEFEQSWLDHVKSKYRWASFLTNTFYLWIAICAFFLLIYLMKKRRERKIIQRWEGEGDYC